jgi:hypothetical protein
MGTTISQRSEKSRQRICFIFARKKTKTRHMTDPRIEGCFDRLWPMCLSIIGNGLRQPFSVVSEVVDALVCTEVPAGTRWFHWELPLEWNMEDGGMGLDSSRPFRPDMLSPLQEMVGPLPTSRHAGATRLQIEWTSTC